MPGLAIILKFNTWHFGWKLKFLIFWKTVKKTMQRLRTVLEPWPPLAWSDHIDFHHKSFFLLFSLLFCAHAANDSSLLILIILSMCFELMGHNCVSSEIFCELNCSPTRLQAQEHWPHQHEPKNNQIYILVCSKKSNNFTPFTWSKLSSTPLSPLSPFT